MRTGGALAWLIYSTHQIIADKIAPERSNIYVEKCSIQFGKKNGLPIAADPPELNFPRPLPPNPAKSAVSRPAPCPNASQHISMTSINI